MSFYRSSKLRNGKKITVAFTSDEEDTDDGRAGGNASDSDDIPILDLIRTVRQDEPIDILTLLEMDEQVNDKREDRKGKKGEFENCDRRGKLSRFLFSCPIFRKLFSVDKNCH